jgi:hypothetical protein
MSIPFSRDVPVNDLPGVLRSYVANLPGGVSSMIVPSFPAELTTTDDFNLPGDGRNI